jgi:hypothetical protein
MADNGGPKIQPKIEKDMLKPLIFANHEKHFKIFSYLVSFGESITTIIITIHCFSLSLSLFL